eukprot:260973-Pleurochrysis_carterae.AAC.3
MHNYCGLDSLHLQLALRNEFRPDIGQPAGSCYFDFCGITVVCSHLKDQAFKMTAKSNERLAKLVCKYRSTAVSYSSTAAVVAVACMTGCACGSWFWSHQLALATTHPGHRQIPA